MPSDRPPVEIITPPEPPTPAPPVTSIDVVEPVFVKSVARQAPTDAPKPFGRIATTAHTDDKTAWIFVVEKTPMWPAFVVGHRWRQGYALYAQSP